MTERNQTAGFFLVFRFRRLTFLPFRVKTTFMANGRRVDPARVPALPSLTLGLGSCEPCRYDGIPCELIFREM